MEWATSFSVTGVREPSEAFFPQPENSRENASGRQSRDTVFFFILTSIDQSGRSAGDCTDSLLYAGAAGVTPGRFYGILAAERTKCLREELILCCLFVIQNAVPVRKPENT